MSPMLIILGIVVLIAIRWVMIYNRFISLNVTIDNSRGDIDVQLKRRADLIPNLVETVKGYAGHEKSTLEAVINARASYVAAWSMDAKVAADNGLSGMLKQLFALAESYPDLKANGSFINLQEQLNQIEDVISQARRYYNASVREFNILVQSFPSNIIANMFSFQTHTMFEATENEREVVKVSF